MSDKSRPAMPMLTVHRPGTEVVANKGKINASVSAVMIEGNGAITYLISWWDSNERKSQWVESFEVDEADEPKKLGIKFNGDRPG